MVADAHEGERYSPSIADMNDPSTKVIVDLPAVSSEGEEGASRKLKSNKKSAKSHPSNQKKPSSSPEKVGEVFKQGFLEADP